jgi:hypothetical protein
VTGVSYLPLVFAMIVFLILGGLALIARKEW